MTSIKAWLTETLNPMLHCFQHDLAFGPYGKIDTMMKAFYDFISKYDGSHRVEDYPETTEKLIAMDWSDFHDAYKMLQKCLAVNPVLSRRVELMRWYCNIANVIAALAQAVSADGRDVGVTTYSY